MSETKAILAITAIVNKEHMAELPTYLGSVMQIFQQHGGQPVGRFKTAESIMGEDSPEMLALIGFPDTDTIKKLVEGEAFKGLDELRARIFSKLNMLICEPM